MTNEEAQIIIGNIPIKPEVLDDCYDITEYQEAKAMAIKALEQQPCEDCVSRTDVLKLMCEKCPVYNCITGCQSYRSIEKMPSVTLKAESEDTE